MSNGKEIGNDPNVVEGASGDLRSFSDCGFDLRISRAWNRATHSCDLAVHLVAICGTIEGCCGISLSKLSRGHRVLDVLAGLLGIAIGIIVFIFPSLGVGTLVFMLAFGTMIYGIVSVAIGASVSRLARGLRALVLLSGFLAMILSVIVLVRPAVAVLTLIFLLSVSFMINGIESIVLAFE